MSSTNQQRGTIKNRENCIKAVDHAINAVEFVHDQWKGIGNTPKSIRSSTTDSLHSLYGLKKSLIGEESEPKSEMSVAADMGEFVPDSEEVGYKARSRNN